MTDTRIIISGISIYELMTAFTDILISVVAFIFFFNLRKRAYTSIRFWSLFFLFMGFSTFAGACSHAFFKVHAGWYYLSVFFIMQITNALAVFFVQQATFQSVVKQSRHHTLCRYLSIFQLILFLIALFSIQKFIVVVFENALGLIPVMILHYRFKQPFARTIANGIAVSFITAFIFIAKLSISDYFNANDLSHLFIVLSLIIMYNGVRRMETYLEKTVAV